MNEFDRDDPRWLRLLGGTNAPLDPTVLARARARLAAGEETPEWLRLLGAAQAPADAAVLVRVRARLAAGGASEVPGWFAWLGSPAALVTACALFVCAGVLSVNMIRNENTTSRDTLVSALIGDDGSYGLPATAVAAVTPASATSNGVDSGEVAR